MRCVHPHAAVFFDPQGRLERTRSPSSEVACTRYVPVHSGLLLANEHEDGIFDPVFLTEEQAAAFLEVDGVINAWLGQCSDGVLASGSDGAVGYRLLELSHLEQAPAAAALGVPDGASWVALRASRGPGGGDGTILASRVLLRDDDYASILAIARGLALWHRSVRFCAICGGKTAPFRDGANQKCTECGARFRPRTDPSVIMLVTRGDRCLLGRQAAWPAGRYSTLAGFVEYGETLEECVVREVAEEAGVRVRRDSVRFVASQPWLFPRSLMVGFIAEVSVRRGATGWSQLGFGHSVVI